MVKEGGTLNLKGTLHQLNKIILKRRGSLGLPISIFPLFLVLLLTLVVAGYIIFLGGGREVQASGPLPGSNEDPLVTKSYVEKYVNERIQELKKSLDEELSELKKKISELPTTQLKQVILAIGNTTAYVNGVPYVLPVAPYQDQATGTSMVPFRFVGEALGARVDYKGDTNTVSYTLGSTSVVLTIGSRRALINGVVRELPAAPRLVGSTTMVPLRVVSEGLGAQVQWYEGTKSITINLPPL
ncbi:Copper amine oxidase N-terminal domain-containing protein [Thermanaeromonas toyohensis ToBE]|uniref:Copper amine oxidase N-terminal domain-containing protein n=1 Tax=Thermanaeromonas toyohensis ToBE TaxID=698762 RepID=A0A1W1V8H4_9FIRM|nr:copper amine oxidase N-terminal domain-containing protein [Thermanaeromonas toyohensis]SMB89546.1 Copper amine oxidase N-terminal domain-containing protein [Thermanaeromonas toyohensis ToBE]